MKKSIAILMALALGFGPFAAFAQLQFALDYSRAKFVSDYAEDDNSATDIESPALWVKYIGTQESGTVDMNSNALEFFSGPLGSEVINGDTGFDVNTGDLCATTNDSLDVTDAQCDTPEELCQVINDSGANWVCALAGVFQDETLATAAEYIDPADAQAKLPGGLPLRLENAGVDSLSVLVRPDAGLGVRLATNNFGHGDIELFLREAPYGSYLQPQFDNPFDGQRVALFWVSANLDSTSAWTLTIRARRYRSGGSVDERIVYSTTDTADATEELLDFSRAPLISAPGETFVITASDDALVTGRVYYGAAFVPER